MLYIKSTILWCCTIPVRNSAHVYPPNKKQNFNISLDPNRSSCNYHISAMIPARVSHGGKHLKGLGRTPRYLPRSNACTCSVWNGRNSSSKVFREMSCRDGRHGRDMRDRKCNSQECSYHTYRIIRIRQTGQGPTRYVREDIPRPDISYIR
jgi:hypothetical protein